ncbi:MAG: hypothetical protein R3190_13145, partial [Thermoanaerobaculia bacterium]|nr:hypothetical protein [Thermoanaerobaculia bacterium]
KGATALYDAVEFGLGMLADVRGRRAVFVFSDGRDEGSALDFAGALEVARASRVPIYTVALVPRSDPLGAGSRLHRLARETGGRSFRVGEDGGVDAIWTRIRRELRSQYLLAYQSTASGGDDFREIRVEVAVDGATARTLRGYYP